MAYKMSLEVNNGTLTLPTGRSILKVLDNVCQIKKKRPSFEQIYRILVEGPKLAVCETTSTTVLLLNSAFTTKDIYFQVAQDNATLIDYGYTQKLQRYNPDTHQVHVTPKHPFWSNK